MTQNRSLLLIALYTLVIGLLLATPVLAAIPTVANVAKDPTQVPPPIWRLSPTTVDVYLEAKEVVAEIAPGKTAYVWTFNGTVPGPMIRVMEGDTVRLHLSSSPDNVEPHNIDLHAAMAPGGGAAVTNVNPGETQTFTFKALRRGAYIYHCSGEGQPWEHIAYGMFGLIQVDPPGGLSEVDKEFYVGQSDWYLIANGDPNNTQPRNDLDSGVLVLDDVKATAEQPTLYTFNGHTKALADPSIFGNAIQSQQNNTVRFFFVTGGPNKGSNFHIIGTIFDRWYPGNSNDAIRNEETVYVAPGSAAVFELTTPVPGTYLLVDHAVWRATLGAAGLLHVAGNPSPTCDSTGRATNAGSWPSDIASPAACGSGH